jgi:hypothetical protein
MLLFEWGGVAERVGGCLCLGPALLLAFLLPAGGEIETELHNGLLFLAVVEGEGELGDAG